MFNTVRFYVSWLMSAIIMYGAFYVWHGIFLNDLNRITFSKTFFLILAAFVYFIVSLVLYKLFESNFLDKHIQHPVLKGLVCGIILGFFLFALVTVLGISFTKNITMEYILLDLVWQISEQALGGVIIGLGKVLIFDPIPEMARRN